MIVWSISVFSSVYYFSSDSFGQSSEESLGSVIASGSGYAVATFVVIGIPILIILLIVLKTKKRLTSSILKKILAGVGLFFLSTMIIIPVISLSFLSDEEISEREAQRELREAVEAREQQLALQKQLEEKAKISQQKQAEIQSEQLSQIPVSCRGVDSMELKIYPTGKQCFAVLNERVEQWCLSETKGNKALADGCVVDFYQRLANLCADPVIGSVEVCLMYNLKDLYRKMIP